ncbi:MAG: PilW family protein [Desulfobulbus sp.]|jgi:type IV pilus assembly protein PilW
MNRHNHFPPGPASSGREAGFTLVELLIAMFVSGLVMSAVVAAYTAQSRQYAAHDNVAEIQQNLRGVLAILPQEIRLAGCDPTGTAGAGFKKATATELHFTMDVRGAGNGNEANGKTTDPGEEIAYAYNQDTRKLKRQTGGAGGFQPLADNIDNLEFNYILENGTTSTTPGNLNAIRAVQVSILGRTASPDPGFIHRRSYTTASDATYTTASGATWKPPQDHYRRRLVITTIQCRNMGF